MKHAKNLATDCYNDKSQMLIDILKNKNNPLFNINNYGTWGLNSFNQNIDGLGIDIALFHNYKKTKIGYTFLNDTKIRGITKPPELLNSLNFNCPSITSTNNRILTTQSCPQNLKLKLMNTHTLIM